MGLIFIVYNPFFFFTIVSFASGKRIGYPSEKLFGLQMSEHQFHAIHSPLAITNPQFPVIIFNVIFLSKFRNVPLLVVIKLNIGIDKVGYLPFVTSYVVGCFCSMKRRFTPDLMNYLTQWLWGLTVITNSCFESMVVI